MRKTKRSKKKQYDFDVSKLHGVIDPSVPDRGNDPYFVKKAAKMKEFLEKHPIPDEILNPK